MKKYNIAIVGCGVIGGALIKWVEEHTEHNILRIDPPKGFNDDISKADVVFVSIHIPTEDDGSQDLTTLEGIIENCPNVPIYIRTTLLPHTCDRLSEKFNKDVNFMPEFLTERTAVEDFYRQPMVFSNHEDMLKEIFVGKEYVVMNSLEAEVTKYAHNVFGALKVTYFNGINELCTNLGIDYQKVREGVLLSGYINAPHTSVPGPDGKFGYGGKCFPKDVNAFIGCLKDTQIYELMAQVPVTNKIYRGRQKGKIMENYDEFIKYINKTNVKLLLKRLIELYLRKVKKGFERLEQDEIKILDTFVQNLNNKRLLEKNLSYEKTISLLELVISSFALLQSYGADSAGYPFYVDKETGLTLTYDEYCIYEILHEKYLNEHNIKVE